MGSNDQEHSALMEQYHRIKEQHRDEILFFRLGDFYEMFNEDAEEASRVLEVTLTSKPVGKDTEVPMAGVPVHSAQPYLETLIDEGYRVAICEQVEEASASSGIVEREVVRVVTPGTITEEEYLESRRNNFLVSVLVEPGDASTERRVGLSYVDLSTGEFEATQFTDSHDLGVLGSEINRLHPSEVVVPRVEEHTVRVRDLTQYREDLALTQRPPWQFEQEEAGRALRNQFEGRAEDTEPPEAPMVVRSAGALLQYLEDTQRQTLTHLDELSVYEREKFMVLDATSQRNLELVSSFTGQDHATLLNVLDDTETAMGSRRLRKWILQPLLNEGAIRARQGALEWFVQHAAELEEIKSLLQQVFDVQRIIGKIGSNRANPKDLKSLGSSLDQVPRIQDTLPDIGLFQSMKSRVDDLPKLRQELAGALVENPPSKISEGEIFQDGYDEELDELRATMEGGKEWIAELQQREQERTGVDSLKVGHNKVHGYYIEVTKANLDAVPEEYERKQTLSNSERYVIPPLKEKEQQIFGAEERSKALEEQLFLELRERVVEHLPALKRNADVLADLDVLAGLAFLARDRGYVRPQVTWEEGLRIEQGRHPVVEEIHEEEFVPNDVELDEERRAVILTGPNMAGKSTYIRQIALICIMAQMGSFVPASEAQVGMIDQVFTRVGAHDFLAGGQSTFMVEMNETAEIVNNATDRSLLVLDEVGRGTSTFDGLALARAVLEYIVERIGARTLFATHYHELTALADEYETVLNMTVRAREWDDEIVFLRQVEEGRSDRSYGIEVGKLAGLPEGIIGRARQILRDLEDEQAGVTAREEARTNGQIDLFHPARPLLDRLASLDVEEMTPLEALNTLHELRESVQEIEME